MMVVTVVRGREGCRPPGEAIGVHDAHEHLHSLETVHVGVLCKVGVWEA